MKHIFTLFTLIAALLMGALHAADLRDNLRVYPNVPGLPPSDQYRFRVRTAGSGETAWQTSFAFLTASKATKGASNERNKGYFGHLAGWSNTYTNFEMGSPVEVEISRVSGSPIRTAMAHPSRRAQACVVRNGKAYVLIPEPCLITVDIDGQMDEQDTGLSKKGNYSGPPIHTLTIFANPILKDRPDPTGNLVYAVKPGEKPPSEGNWKTLYFLPGVHDIGLGFPVHANKSYYIPGDAIVYGTLNNHKNNQDGHHIRIFGYGTLSGARLTHPLYQATPWQNATLYDPIEIAGAANTAVEGITLADCAHHSLMLYSRYNPQEPTDVRWVKIFTWRVNGDGINPFSNGLIEDCFIRTQDDSSYANGRGIRRVVYWNDVNGSTFALGSLPNRPLVIEDCDVVYARATWNLWSGGRLFNMRGEGSGEAGKGVIFRNIRVEDKRPTLQHFMVLMQGLAPYRNPDDKRKPGDLTGILFQNISLAAPSVLGEPDILWGMPGGQIMNLTFDNVTLGGKVITDLSHFKHNEQVKDLRFVEHK